MLYMERKKHATKGGNKVMPTAAVEVSNRGRILTASETARLAAAMKVNSPLLTAREAARFLRISDCLLWKLVREKKLKPLRGLGGRVMFNRAYLEKLCAGAE